ncbi:MAG: hypothetical protein ACFFEU_12845, partial [Candidatus Thorarchaeota archaeon]
MSRKYDFALFGYGSDSEFIQRFHNIQLIKKHRSRTELIPSLLEICKTNEIDVLLPATYEFLNPLCQN